jgi:hypothetical protein
VDFIRDPPPVVETMGDADVAGGVGVGLGRISAPGSIAPCG